MTQLEDELSEQYKAGLSPKPTQLEEFCKDLRDSANDHDGRANYGTADQLQAAAEMLERCYEILGFEGPDGRYRDELNQRAATAMKPKQEPRPKSQKGGGD